MNIPTRAHFAPMGLLLMATSCWQAGCSGSNDNPGPSDTGPSEDSGMHGDTHVPDAGPSHDVGPVGDGSPVDGLVYDGPSPSDAEHDADGSGQDAPSDGPDDGPFDSGDADFDGEPPDAGAVKRPLCYFGDFDDDGSQLAGCVTFPGLSRVLLDGTGLVGDSVTAVAVAPDGDEVALAVRPAAGEAVGVWVARFDGTQPPKQLTVAPTVESEVESIVYSPDGVRLAYTADFDVPGASSLYSIPVVGGAPTRVSPAAQAGHDVTGFAWARSAPGAHWLAFVGDLTTDGVYGLWTVDVAVPKPQAQILLDDATLGDGDVQRDIAWDAQGHVLFRSNHTTTAVFQLFQASHDGAMVEVVPETTVANGLGTASVGSFGVSPKGTSVAFSANSPESNVYEVFVAGLQAGSGPALRVSSLAALSDSQMLSGPAFQTPIAWSPDATRLAVVADWRLAPEDHDDTFSAFVLPSTGSPGGWRVLGAPQSVDLNVRDARFAPDAMTLFVRGDLVDNGAFELFAIGNLLDPNQDPASARIEEVPDQGDVLGLATGP